MLETGQLLPLSFLGREFTVVVIDPNGLGPGKPTVGIGLRGMSRHTNMPVSTLVRRVIEVAADEEAEDTLEAGKYLKLPSGKLFKITPVEANDGNTYQVIEAADWVELSKEWAKKPGRLGTETKNGLIDFLGWFAAEGFYAAAYTVLKRTYTYEDSQRIQQWLVSREAGKPARKDWAWAISEQGGNNPFKYGKWTNYVYKGLFGMDAAEMKKAWEAPMSGSKHIARNYIPESIGLEMVGFCEKMVAVMEFEDLERAHDEAIRLTQIKFQQKLDANRLRG
ncbi:hypothetical protein [cf. Phormidesmis sp. LEGE 11477]|uniref:hypothetical protein n=1 Tax=cf. Phormidesmis sp. LEGE 11477 TaxID=1828680 RepID=UPI00187E76E5|nr:hypothetical protein [cf. Phormidesmis sp. LEGE 11477]MBE9064485.1 hypothetical protein [cf. Phormidesmis sp. LEGE 11477]